MLLVHKLSHVFIFSSFTHSLSVCFSVYLTTQGVKIKNSKNTADLFAVWGTEERGLVPGEAAVTFPKSLDSFLPEC